MSFWALAIQQKFQFEISEISRAQWNGAFRWHRPDSSHHPFGYCSCKQDTKERYWGQKFCQIKQEISVRPTEITVPVKVDHLQSWSRIFRSDQTEMVRCTNRNVRNFGLNRKGPLKLCTYLLSFITPFPPPPLIIQSGFVKHRLKSLSLLTCPECLKKT